MIVSGSTNSQLYKEMAKEAETRLEAAVDLMENAAYTFQVQALNGVGIVETDRATICESFLILSYK